VWQNSDVYKAGQHYGVPGILVDGTDTLEVVKAGAAITDYIRAGNGPAILQVHTYRFNGHSPADPEHERGRKEEKKWARANEDPIKRFEDEVLASKAMTEEELKALKKEVRACEQREKGGSNKTPAQINVCSLLPHLLTLTLASLAGSGHCEGRG